MSEVTYKLTQQRQKAYIKAYAIICIAILAFAGLYFARKWAVYANLNAAMENNAVLLDQLNQELADEKASFDTGKAEFDTLATSVETDLKTIFPETDQYKELTRKFDEFEEKLNEPARNNPFEVSNMEFQQAKKLDNYSVLPLRMNVRSSRQNFTKFLHMVETSGSLNNKLRVMDISSIRLNFGGQSEEDTGPEIITFTVQINAYFQ